MSGGYLDVDLAGADDADLLASDMVDRVQVDQPEWSAYDGDPVTRLIAAFADVWADRLATAATVPLAIFRHFGEAFADTPAVDAEPASFSATVTAVDTAGYVVPEGSRVATSVDGVDYVFASTAEATIPTGSSSVAVTFEAEDPGVAGNGLAGPWTLVDTLAFVDTVTPAASTAGGVDAETDAEYRDRLAARLRLMAPRPILPADFETMARDVVGVARARAVDGHHPGVNEVQTVTVTGASGGDFTLSYDGQGPTAAIAYDATAATVQTALEALSNIASGDVSCTGGPLSTAAVSVEFTGALAKTNVAEMTADDTGLTGGGSEAAAVATVTPGVAPSSGNDKTIAIAAVDADGDTVDTATQAELVAYLDGFREVNFQVLWLDPVRTAVAVVCTVTPESGADPATVEADVQAALEAFIDPATFAGGDATPPVWRAVDDVDYLAAVGVASRVEGVDRVESLTLNGSPADVTLSGVTPLPAAFDAVSPSTVTVTVAT